jgi:thiol-disulfide isomerase/thioredoxin
MGRLPIVIQESAMLGAVVLVAAGCDKDPARAEETGGARSRSQAVEATTAASTTPAATSKPKASAEKAPKPPRALCSSGELERQGKPLPKKPISRSAAAGVPQPPSDLSVGGGKWTWVNFWAAWCVPCREEIPRLKAWEQRLGSRLRVEFVSIDDDQRQLEQFLNGQPAAGLKASFWLKEGKEREDWLVAADVDPDPELPLHLLVDARGKVRCKVQGAVEDADFEAVQALVAR